MTHHRRPAIDPASEPLRSLVLEMSSGWTHQKLAGLTGLTLDDVRATIEAATPAQLAAAHRRGVVGMAPAGVAEVGNNPLMRAGQALDGRAVLPKGAALWKLDGRTVSNIDLVSAANRVLAAAGKPLIAYPGVIAPPGRTDAPSAALSTAPSTAARRR